MAYQYLCGRSFGSSRLSTITLFAKGDQRAMADSQHGRVWNQLVDDLVAIRWEVKKDDPSVIYRFMVFESEVSATLCRLMWGQLRDAPEYSVEIDLWETPK